MNSTNFFSTRNPNSLNVSNSQKIPILLSTQNNNEGFVFKERTLKVLWKEIIKIDIEKIKEDNDLSSIDALINNIVYSDVSKDELITMPEDYLSQLIILLQLISQYYIYTTNKFYEENLFLKEKLDLIQNKGKESATNEENLKKLKKKLEEKNRLIDNYKKIIKNNNILIEDDDDILKIHWKCQFCTKKFKGPNYLEEHMHRCHLIDYDYTSNYLNTRNKNTLISTNSKLDPNLNLLKDYYEKLIERQQLNNGYNLISSRLGIFNNGLIENNTSDLYNTSQNNKNNKNYNTTNINNNSNNNKINNNSNEIKKDLAEILKNNLNKINQAIEKNNKDANDKFINVTKEVKNFQENIEKQLKNLKNTQSQNKVYQPSVTFNERYESNNKYNDALKSSFVCPENNKITLISDKTSTQKPNELSDSVGNKYDLVNHKKDLSKSNLTPGENIDNSNKKKENITNNEPKKETKIEIIKEEKIQSSSILKNNNLNNNNKNINNNNANINNNNNNKNVNINNNNNITAKKPNLNSNNDNNKIKNKNINKNKTEKDNSSSNKSNYELLPERKMNQEHKNNGPSSPRFKGSSNKINIPQIKNESMIEKNYSKDPRSALISFYKRYIERDNKLGGDINDYMIKTIPSSFKIKSNKISDEIKRSEKKFNLDKKNNEDILKEINDLTTLIYKNDNNKNRVYKYYSENIDNTFDICNSINECQRLLTQDKAVLSSTKIDNNFNINSPKNLNNIMNNYDNSNVIKAPPLQESNFNLFENKISNNNFNNGSILKNNNNNNANGIIKHNFDFDNDDFIARGDKKKPIKNENAKDKGHNKAIQNKSKQSSEVHYTDDEFEV